MLTAARERLSLLRAVCYFVTLLDLYLALPCWRRRVDSYSLISISLAVSLAEHTFGC